MAFLRDTLTTDAGLAHLETLVELREPVLDDTAITNAGLVNLLKLPKLRSRIPSRFISYYYHLIKRGVEGFNLYSILATTGI